jgi:hypothetical protein
VLSHARGETVQLPEMRISKHSMDCAPARRLFDGAEWLAPVSEAILKGHQWKTHTVSPGAHSSGEHGNARLVSSHSKYRHASSRALTRSQVSLGRAGFGVTGRRIRADCRFRADANCTLTYSPNLYSAFLGGEIRRGIQEIAHCPLEDHH